VNRMARQFMSITSRPAFLICAALMMLLAAAPVSGQSNPPQEQKQEPAKAEPAKAPPKEPAEPQREGQIMAPTQTPDVPGGDGFTLGAYQGHADIELGYRWVSDVSGNKDVYRSMVNLGSGPKLLRSNISLRSNYGAGGLFDRLDISANSWGGDPYNTVRVNVGLSDKYEFRADYRNLNYYNYLPQYANPLLLTRGILVGQHSLDVTYRSSNFELRLFPNNKIRPFVGYSRSSGFGPGFTTREFTGNEFPVSTNWRYSADDYRGGVELSLPKSTIVIEQGYRVLRNDTGVESGANPGNNPNARFLGNPVTVGSLAEGYRDRTTLPFTKLVAKFAPLANLKFTGRYIYSMADLDSGYGEVASGAFVNLAERLVYGSGLDNFSGHAKRPDHNGSFLVEFSPVSRLLLTDRFETRNTHTSGATLLASIFYGARSLAGPGPISDQKLSSLAQAYLSYNRLSNLAEAEFELWDGLSVRGGYRYTNADAKVGDSEDEDLLEPNSSSYKQNSGIVGLVYRRARWLKLGFDYEKNKSDGTLTRTDLFNFDQYRFDWRIGSWHHFSTTGKIWGLRNSNDQTDIDLRSHNRNYSVEMNYDPTERFNFSVDYSRSSIFSDIAILLPQTLQLDRSLFDERTNGFGGSVGVGIYRGSRFDLGYRGIFNNGTAPLNFHQPFAEFTVPLPNRLAFKTYWQYFGYNEKAPFTGTMINQDPRGFQDFHTHLVTFSLAYQY
jgi:hypothetical protein